MHSTTPVLSLAAVASACAGLIHAAAAGSHADVATLPTLFGIAAVAQVGWAALAVLRPGDVAAVIGLAVNGLAIATLVVSRTVGISVVSALDDAAGLGTIGLQDGGALVFELGAVAAAGVAFVEGDRRRLPSPVVPAIGALGLCLAIPAMATPHDHSTHVHDDAAEIAAGPHGDHTDDHVGGHDHGGDETTPPEAARTGADEALGYPADFVRWLDTAETPQQRAAAEELLVETTEAMKAFPDEEAVQAAGFVSIGDGATGWEHYVNVERIADPRILDPADIESIVLEVHPDGTKEVASAMYLLPFGATMEDAPDIAGELTQWHDHQNLCWKGTRVVGTTNASGSCPRGEFRATQPMIHVWVIPHECGPFAGIEGSHGSGCSHGDHGGDASGDHGHDDHDG